MDKLSHNVGNRGGSRTIMTLPNHNDGNNTEKKELNRKPRFLKQLEKFLQEELVTLKCTEVKPSELRLQAHRTVFEFLIGNFRTYRPLLAAIKNEYEMMLTHQKQQIRELLPLQEAMFTFSEQYDKQKMDYLLDQKKAIAALRKANRHQVTRLAGMKNEKKDLQKQVERLQEKIQDESNKFHEESDARRLLINELVDLRQRPGDQLFD